MLPTKPCFYTGLFVAFKPGFIYIGTKVFKLPCSCARTATLFLISSSHIIDFQGGREYYTITTKSTGESPPALLFFFKKHRVLVQSNLVIRNVLIRNKLALRNFFAEFLGFTLKKESQKLVIHTFYENLLEPNL